MTDSTGSAGDASEKQPTDGDTLENQESSISPPKTMSTATDAPMNATPLEQPRTVEALTPEQRQRIKAMLLEKQRQARQQAIQQPTTSISSPTVPEAPAVTPTESTTTDLQTPIKDTSTLIDSAVKFLSSSQVQSASIERQNEFLKTKGLTDQDIALARQKVANSITHSSPEKMSASTTLPALPPPVPPRPYPTHHVNTVAIPSAMPLYQPPSPFVMIKVIAMILALFAASSAGIWFAFKKRLQSSYAVFAVKYHAFINDRQVRISQWMEKMYDFCQFYSNNNDLQTVPKTVSTSIQETQDRMDAIHQAVEGLKHRIHSFDPQKHPETPPESDMIALKQSVDQLSHLITRHTYFSPSFTTYTSSAGIEESESSQKWSKAIEDVRNEIRSIKGMLLSKRNFPGVAPAAPQ